MTKSEFSDAVKLADTPGFSWGDADFSVFDGSALPGFEWPITTTIHAMAANLAYHCKFMNGKWDSVALNEMRDQYRHKVEIVGYTEGMTK